MRFVIKRSESCFGKYRHRFVICQDCTDFTAANDTAEMNTTVLSKECVLQELEQGKQDNDNCHPYFFSTQFTVHYCHGGSVVKTLCYWLESCEFKNPAPPG